MLVCMSDSCVHRVLLSFLRKKHLLQIYFINFSSFLQLFTLDLLVLSQQFKHKNNVRNLFKVNNIDTKTMSRTSFCCLYCQLWTDFTNCSSLFWTSKCRLGITYLIGKNSHPEAFPRKSLMLKIFGKSLEQFNLQLYKSCIISKRFS